MPDLTAALRELFGFSAFRPGQEEVVRAAVEGRDTLALMPTGSGKSLTYQLAAMLRPKPTLVLSPLIALMKDQVDKLPPPIAATATFVNSSLTATETAARLDGVASGQTRILYAAPERLRQASFAETLRRIDVGLVVVDEAHCVSMWGHDFRPDYLFIRQALDALDGPAVLGLTATATPATARAISDGLGRELDEVRTSVVRPNLRYDVEQVTNGEDRMRALVARLGEEPGSAAIVYARSRRSTEEIARVLRGHGVRAEHYHAGLEPSERTRVQDAFVSGSAHAVVATTAFGMGIDKADVRLVSLVNYPDSLESYVQMVGRAGRDGAPSNTVLLAGAHDAASLRRFAASDVPSTEDLRAAYRLLRDRRGVVDPDELASIVPERDPRVLVGMLEQAGLARRTYDEGRYMRIEVSAPGADATARVTALLDQARAVANIRADRVIAFATSARCRHAQVAEHFGESLTGLCGMCDICAPRAKAVAPQGVVRALPADIASTIVHTVEGLSWPLGRRSLVATLRGSIKAPPSARRSASYGILAAASEGEVARWVQTLERAGVLTEATTSEGFRVLCAHPEVDRPRLGAIGAGGAGSEVVERLRSWRSRRSSEDGVPAYVVLHDSTLNELAANRPRTIAELSAVKGLGPTKLDRYGADLLAVLSR